jgi:hypothetical protein
LKEKVSGRKLKNTKNREKERTDRENLTLSIFKIKIEDVEIKN